MYHGFSDLIKVARKEYEVSEQANDTSEIPAEVVDWDGRYGRATVSSLLNTHRLCSADGERRDAVKRFVLT